MVGERIGKSLYRLAIIPKLSSKESRYSACLAVPSPTSMGFWYQRLTHTSYKNISKMARNGAVHGIILPTNTNTPNYPCIGCMAGKMHRLPFPVGRTRANQVGQLIYADICGPMHVTTPSGARFSLLLTDYFSGWRNVFFLKKKSEVPEFFKDYANLQRSETGNLIHTLKQG